jgi:hypothetical protein
MKLVTGVLGVVLSSVAAGGMACSSGAIANTVDGGTSVGPIDASPDTPAPTPVLVGQPPARPDGVPTTASGQRTFAVRALYLGDATRAGTASASAWKSLGYNLDGKVSNSRSTDVCQRAQGASASVHTDGDTGIDNAFGLNIMAIISGLQPDATVAQNSRIGDGGPTTLFQITGLSADETQTATGLVVDAFAASPFDSIAENTGKKPTFSLVDNWPVLPSATKSGTVASGAAVRSSEAYMVGGTLVARFDLLNVQVLLLQSTMVLPLRKVVVTGRVSNGALSDGVIAGVISTADMRQAFATQLNVLTNQFCDPSSRENVLSLISQSADIAVDGSNPPTANCDAISAGFAFEAAAISEVKTVGSVPAPGKDLCAN